MKSVILLVSVLFASVSFAGFQVYQSTTNLGVFNKIKCSTGLTCSKVTDKLNITLSGAASGALAGDGTGALSGFLEKQVTATATTLTAAQCGSTIVNSGAIAINLPNGAAALLGCQFTFITTNASNFDVNPGNSDQIVLLTNAVGDAIRNATVGNSVTLQYAATNVWAPVGAEKGTYTDIN